MADVLPIDGIVDSTNTKPVVNTPKVVDTPEQIQYDADLAALNKLNGIPRIRAKEAFELKYPEGRPVSTPVKTINPTDLTDATIAADLAKTTNLGIGEALLLDKTYGDELQAVFTLYKTNKVAAAELLFKSKWAKLDTDARDRYLVKIENSELYQEQLKSWLVGVKKELAGRNLTVSDTALADYYLKGIDNATILDEAISGLTAASGDTAALTNLRITAEANGLNLGADFAKEQDSWLQAIARGQDPNKFYALIRKKAGEGKSEYVKNQLLAGKDLRSIYGIFLNEISTAFEIPSESIDLNDPLFAKAFSDKGTIKLGDFKTLLQNDSRYKGTVGAITNENIKESTLSYLNKVAKDNGIDLTAKYGPQIDQWVNDVIKGKSLDSIAQIIRNDLGTDKSKYIKEQLALGKNLNEIYGSYISQMATTFGVPADSIDINDPLLAKAFTKDGTMNATQFTNLLRTDARFVATPTATSEGNVAGQARQQLARIAQDNGYNLDIDFKDQIDGWLARIRNGESVDLVGQAIRDQAGTGRTKYVQDLLKSGYNLNGIYGTYISLMAQTFGIDPETISENDPLLQKVFTDKGSLTISNFEALLRTDVRFKGSKVEGQQKDFRQSIIDRALAQGVTLDDAAIDDIVSNALSMGISASSSLVDGLIRAKLSYSPGKTLGGVAGGALGQLKATAAANGLDFDTQFGTQAQTWLSKILQGESPDTFKNIIRQTAKLGLPEKVGSLLDLGVDLETIYSPYKNVMSSILEINPQTIGLDDKTLRSAIGEKEMTLYDWQNSLRKDPRWQYTKNARQDVSGIGLNVLQQLGFQG